MAQVGQSALKKAVRFFSSYDQFLTHRLEVRDANHQPVLMLTRPAKVFKSRVIVARPDGSEVGQIVQDNVFGKIRFKFLVGDQQIGGIQAENWRAWNFAVRRPHRRGGRPDHEDVGGLREDDVHHGRQLRRADPPAAARPAREPGRRLPR